MLEFAKVGRLWPLAEAGGHSLPFDFDLLTEFVLNADSAAVLPAGTEVRGICPSGESFWARTATIDASDDDGETRHFLKASLTCYTCRLSGIGH